MAFLSKKPDNQAKKPGMFERLRSGLEKTRHKIFGGIEELFRGKKEIDAELLEEIESRLLTADLGIESTTIILDNLNNALKRNELKDLEQLINKLKSQMVELLKPVEIPLLISQGRDVPFVILVVGVNGAGKTTTIGKMARHYLGEGKSVLLAAGDTFRAAAIEQIQEWGKKTGVPVISQKTGADSAAVIYDALQSARAKNIDIVIADTAGRLHNKDNLMEELGKIRRTISKFDDSLPVEVMLVLDAGTGQNALIQARQFNEMVNITGISLTKLDGTAKGGVIFSIAHKLATPIRFIGVGEKGDDLRPFVAEDFVDAMFNITHD